MAEDKKEPELPEVPEMPTTPKLEVPEIPQIESHNEKTDEKADEEATTEEVLEEQKKKKVEKKKESSTIQQTFQTVTSQMYRLIEIEPYKAELKEFIKNKLKPGNILTIGDKIGSFAEQLIELNDEVIAFDTSPTFITPKAEVRNKEILEKLELKPFKKEKFMSIRGPFQNIIFFFALKKLNSNDRKEILAKAKEILSRNGQIIVVDEFYPKNPILFVITGIKILFSWIKAKLTNRIYYYPLRKLNKLAKQLELKFFDIKSDAQGRIRTYIFTKRWGALIT